MGLFGSIGKGVGGFLGLPQERRAERSANQQYNISRDLWNNTGGLREGVLGDLQSFLAGGSPSSLNFMGPARDNLEDQFNVAKENIIGSTGARGGQLSKALIDLNTNRAKAVGGLDANLRQALFNMASGIGFQTPQTALGGFDNAGNLSLTHTAFANDRAMKIGEQLGMAMFGGGGGGGAPPMAPGGFSGGNPLLSNFVGVPIG